MGPLMRGSPPAHPLGALAVGTETETRVNNGRSPAPTGRACLGRARVCQRLQGQGAGAQGQGQAWGPGPGAEEGFVVPLTLRVFSFEDLRAATRNFRRDSKLGEGGFGSVYRGWIPDDTGAAVEDVAVKILNPQGLQGHKEWKVRAVRAKHNTLLDAIHAAGTVFPRVMQALAPCSIRVMLWVSRCLLRIWASPSPSSRPSQPVAPLPEVVARPSPSRPPVYLPTLACAGGGELPGADAAREPGAPRGVLRRDEQRLLVYEFMCNGSLENHLFRSKEAQGELSLSHDYITAAHSPFARRVLLRDQIRPASAPSPLPHPSLPPSFSASPHFPAPPVSPPLPPSLLSPTPLFPMYTNVPLPSRASFASAESTKVMPWNRRMSIALGAATGLAYLHGASKQVIYRDFKTSNILLSEARTLPCSQWPSKQVLAVPQILPLTSRQWLPVPTSSVPSANAFGILSCQPWGEVSTAAACVWVFGTLWVQDFTAKLFRLWAGQGRA